MYLAHYCRRALRHAAYLTIGAWLGGCLSMAQAAEITPIKGTYSPKTGTQAPARYNGPGLTQQQMNSNGLAAPQPGNKWVQIGDKYVQINTTDGTVQSVEPAVK